MTATQLLQSNPLPTITWEKLPDDFVLPDEPVDNKELRKNNLIIY
jgi:hypothetical protein